MSHHHASTSRPRRRLPRRPSAAKRDTKPEKPRRARPVPVPPPVSAPAPVPPPPAPEAARRPQAPTVEALLVSGAGDGLLGQASCAELLVRALSPIEGDPVERGLGAVADDLAPLRRALEADDDIALADAVFRVQHRVRVLAELHVRQLAQVRANVAARALAALLGLDQIQDAMVRARGQKEALALFTAEPHLQKTRALLEELVAR